MKLISHSIPEDHGYIIPIGDLHVGDKAFGARGKRKLKGYIDWVMDHPNAFVFLMGDILNCASRHSKTSPFESSSDEYEYAVELFKPVKSRVIGCITGNHENRVVDSFGFNPLQSFCRELGFPYLGTSAVIRVRVGAREQDSNWYQQIYHLYAHHTTGGGGSLGSALNRVTKLQDIVQNIDVYMGGHNHNLVNGVRTVYRPGRSKMEEHKIHYVDCGSYLEYTESYAEASMFTPGKLGSPRIRLSGVRDHHDIHVSL